jgi:hypothetical protein
MRKRGERGDLNRSCASFLESERSPKDGRTFALVLRHMRGLGTNVRPYTPGEGANDRPMVGERSLPQCL